MFVGHTHIHAHTQNTQSLFFGNCRRSGRYSRIRTNSKGRNKTLIQTVQAQPVISRGSPGPALTIQHSTEWKNRQRQLWLVSCQKIKIFLFQHWFQKGRGCSVSLQTAQPVFAHAFPTSPANITARCDFCSPVFSVPLPWQFTPAEDVQNSIPLNAAGVWSPT